MKFIRNNNKAIDFHSSMRHISEAKKELAKKRAEKIINLLNFEKYLKNNREVILHLGIETKKCNAICLRIIKLKSNRYKYEILSCHINEVDYFVKIE